MSPAFRSHIHHPPISRKTMQQPVIPPLPEELKRDAFTLVGQAPKTWNFNDKKTGTKIEGSKNFAHAMYGPNKLAFAIEDIKRGKGIVVKDEKSAYMMLSLTAEQSAKVRKYVDDVIFDIIWSRRTDLVQGPKVHKMTEPMQLRSNYNGIVRDGKPKIDKTTKVPLKSADGSPQFWADSITLNIPMAKGQVDTKKVRIVDLKDRPYAWTSLEDKDLKEVVMEVSEVSFTPTGDIYVKCVAKCIVPNEEGVGDVSYTTRRQAELLSEKPKTEPAPVSKVSEQPTPPPQPQQTTVVEPPAKKIKA